MEHGAQGDDEDELLVALEEGGEEAAVGAVGEGGRARVALLPAEGEDVAEEFAGASVG